MPVRLGTPKYVVGMDEVVNNPIYATGVGLLMYARQHRFSHRPELAEAGGLRAAWSRMRSWFQGNF
jgi:cell division protein FtsA